MAMFTVNQEIKIVTEVCIKCGVIFGLTGDYQQRRRWDHETFYCPSGHAQMYPAKNQVEKLAEELEQERRRRIDEVEAARVRADFAEAAKKKAESELARVTKRAHAGVCPCCKRSFANVARHMQTKHKDLK